MIGGVVLFFFAQKWLLGRPGASLAHILSDHSPARVVGCACFRAPYSRSFSCSPSVYTNMCLRVCVSEQKLHLPLFTCLHIVYPCACLCFWPGEMDYRSTLGLKLARFLREACVELGWQIISLAGLLLIVNLRSCFPTGGLWHRICMRLPVQQTKIRCRIVTQAYKSMLKKHYIPLYNSLARNLRPAFRETCAMQVLR